MINPLSLLFSRAKAYVRPPKTAWNPRLWASKMPFRQTDNFVEIFRAMWENRSNLPYAWRILSQGVCDGCALGTSGLADWTIEGVHLCNVRLRLLRLNTLPPFDPALLADVARLQALGARDLRALGRLPTPMLRLWGETGFSPIDWAAALDLMAEKCTQSTPERLYFYLTSRGIPNETYYSAQKAVRAIGTNNLDNAARICHSPSTFGLKAALGVAATTCSYSDLIGTDLVTFIGSNVSSNQPVMMKYLYHARKAGTKVAMVNPYREPGMENYWIPSDLESALFGTRISEYFYQVRTGGDIAFLNGVAKVMLAEGWHDKHFIEQHTADFATFQAHIEALDWETLEQAAGLPQQAMADYARLVAQAEKAVFVWGMGITQHTTGEDNVHAIINLALLKGFVGRPGCGLMPIRGHSGVQGGAEMGAYATALPGGEPINADTAAALGQHYGFDIPTQPGMTTPEMLSAAADGTIDFLFAVGGNFREVMPDPAGVTVALANIPLRVHMDITLSSQMLIDPAEAVLLLPALTRYEIPGGVTQTSTERRVIFSPYVPGPLLPDARCEGDVLGELAARIRPELADHVRFSSTQAIREEIARVIPMYQGIEKLSQAGDQFQYGGPHLCQDWQFPTPSGKAHFSAVSAESPQTAPNVFIIATRRGKQFNSMVHEDHESRNNLARNAVLINAADAQRMGLSAGAAVTLHNDFGHYDGQLAISDIAPGTLQVYWPEASPLIDPNLRSPLAKIPAYKAVEATLSRADSGSPSTPIVKV